MLKITLVIACSLLAAACNPRLVPDMEIPAVEYSETTHCFYSPTLQTYVSFEVPAGQPVPTMVRSGTPMPVAGGDVRVITSSYVEEIRLLEVRCIVVDD